MAQCKICQTLNQGSLKKIYEDKQIVAALCPSPVSSGHIWVISKTHYPILEKIPDFLVADLFFVANKISVSVFEALGVQGTNIFVQNGIEAGQKYSHFIINIIPRMPNDNIALEWQPKQLTEEEMSTVELKIKDQTANVGKVEKKEDRPINLDKREKKQADQTDFLVKSLRRIP